MPTGTAFPTNATVLTSSTQEPPPSTGRQRSRRLSPLGAGASATAPCPPIWHGRVLSLHRDMQIRGRASTSSGHASTGPDRPGHPRWERLELLLQIHISARREHSAARRNSREDELLFDPFRMSWHTEDSSGAAPERGPVLHPDLRRHRNVELLPIDGSPTSGKIHTIADRNANTLTMVYNGSGQLIRVMDTLNRQFRSPTTSTVSSRR